MHAITMKKEVMAGVGGRKEKGEIIISKINRKKNIKERPLS